MKHLTSAAVAGGVCLVAGHFLQSHLWTALAVFACQYFYCLTICSEDKCNSKPVGKKK